MHKAVDRRDRHGGVWKDRIPRAKRLIGGDQQGQPLVAGTDQFKDHAGFSLALPDVGKIVEDEQVVFVEFLDGLPV